MKNRIKESKDYKTSIRNDPFKMLEVIEMKMYSQVRAKYEYTQVTDTLVQLINTKLENGETLTNYTKRIKQSRDNVKSILGEEFLNDFIKTTDKYARMSNSKEMMELKKGAFKKWTAYMMLRNGDNNKYR